MKEKLRERDYPNEVIEAGIARAREVVEPGGRQHRLIVQYDRRSSPALGQILRNNYEAAVNKDTRFKALFRKCPKPTFQRGINLKQLLVRAKLPRRKPLSTRTNVKEATRGVQRCNKGTSRRQCSACTLLTKNPQEVRKEIKISSTGETL